ncbi:hypothetical protein [Streptomyces zaomyceticus]|uniref:hypothetical protein n=1 Tax=Streptomyces zaomyceticus TaxID=68286 RepID=UPI002E250A50
MKAVITAMSALPADGSLGREEHEERLMELVMLRDTIHSVMAEARHVFGWEGPAPAGGTSDRS